MARQRAAIGKYHGPGESGIGRPAPQFVIDEISDAPEEQPDRADRGGDVAQREDRNAVAPAEQDHRGDAAQEAAMKRHAALPQLEDLERMLDEEGKIIEQHIAGAAAEDDPERDPKNEIVELRHRHRRAAGPQSVVPDQRARIEPAQYDAADISERIPADRDRADRDRNGIEYRKDDDEEQHRTGLLREIAAIERQQPLPVPFRGVAVVNRTLRKGEPVMGAGIDFDLGIGAGVLHALLDLVDA